ncbi:MAG TPA: hypothetical protein PKE31_11925 [Pseudomonadota bacterium]|jgi:hypothetical protein|nr:hypothetical protein [Pseudomonadota bacterium]
MKTLWVLAVALWVCVGAEKTARGNPVQSWFVDHMALDLAAVTSWRVAWADERNPGFNMVAAGGELHVGLEFDNGVGFLMGTRAVFGPKTGLADGPTHADVSGNLLLLFRVTDWVRLSAGPTAGRLWQWNPSESDGSQPSAASIGGLLRLGLDFYPRQANVLKALTLWVRVEIDKHTGASDSALPSTSLAVSGSFGFRL